MTSEDMLRAEVYGLLATTTSLSISPEEVDEAIREARQDASHALEFAALGLWDSTGNGRHRVMAAVYRWLAREIREVGRR